MSTMTTEKTRSRSRSRSDSHDSHEERMTLPRLLIADEESVSLKT